MDKFVHSFQLNLKKKNNFVDSYVQLCFHPSDVYIQYRIVFNDTQNCNWLWTELSLVLDVHKVVSN